MGCDIHSFAEKRNKETGKWEKVTNVFTLDDFDKKYYNKEKGDCPFPNRSYSIFAFLADVRNYDRCTPIKQPAGFPKDASREVKREYKKWEGDAHSASYLTARELSEFDYDQTFWNRRITRQEAPNYFNGAALAEEGEGVVLTYRENLGAFFFTHLEELKSIGELDDVRIVFWFDN